MTLTAGETGNRGVYVSVMTMTVEWEEWRRESDSSTVRQSPVLTSRLAIPGEHYLPSPIIGGDKMCCWNSSAICLHIVNIYCGDDSCDSSSCSLSWCLGFDDCETIDAVVAFAYWFLCSMELVSSFMTMKEVMRQSGAFDGVNRPGHWIRSYTTQYTCSKSFNSWWFQTGPIPELLVGNNGVGIKRDKTCASNHAWQANWRMIPYDVLEASSAMPIETVIFHPLW